MKPHGKPLVAGVGCQSTHLDPSRSSQQTISRALQPKNHQVQGSVQMLEFRWKSLISSHFCVKRRPMGSPRSPESPSPSRFRSGRGGRCWPKRWPSPSVKLKNPKNRCLGTMPKVELPGQSHGQSHVSAAHGRYNPHERSIRRPRITPCVLLGSSSSLG
jgi:hypothetical protein